MKNKFLTYIFVIILCLSLTFLLTGCGETNKTKEKVGQEVKLVENKLVAMINGLNNIKLTNYVLAQEDMSSESSSQNGQNQKSGSESGESDSSGSEGGESSEGGGSSEGGSSSEGGKEASSGGDSGKSGGSSGGNSSDSSDSKSSMIQYEMKEQGILENNQEVDWKATKNEVENLYSVWSNIIVDLHSVNVSNEDILSFSNQLDDLIVDVQNEDKVNTSAMLANLYSYIPKYAEHYTDDSNNINLLYAKSNVIASYALIEQNDWNGAKQRITTAQEYVTNMINNANEKSVQNQKKMSKVYVSLGEFNNCIDKQDKSLYYIKYKSLMENVENVE